jgi:hypothetical protein
MNHRSYVLAQRLRQTGMTLEVMNGQRLAVINRSFCLL